MCSELKNRAAGDEGGRTIPANPRITHGKSRLQTSRCLQVAEQSVPELLENARNGPCVRQRLRGSMNRSATSNMKARNYIKLRAVSIHTGNANRVLHASVFCAFLFPSLVLPVACYYFKSISKRKLSFSLPGERLRNFHNKKRTHRLPRLINFDSINKLKIDYFCRNGKQKKFKITTFCAVKIKEY